MYISDLVATFNRVKKFSDHQSNILDSLLCSRDPVIEPHTVIELSAALVDYRVEEGEGRVARVGRHFER